MRSVPMRGSIRVRALAPSPPRMAPSDGSAFSRPSADPDMAWDHRIPGGNGGNDPRTRQTTRTSSNADSSDPSART